MLRINDLIPDPNEALEQKLLVAVDPAFRFDREKGESTEELEGYRYTIVLPKKKFEKLSVKVKNTKTLMEIKEGSFVEVVFTDLELFIWNNEICARATGISPLSQNK